MNKKQREAELEKINADQVAMYNLDLLGKIDLTLNVVRYGNSIAFLIPKNQAQAYGIKAGQIWKLKAQKISEAKQ